MQATAKVRALALQEYQQACANLIYKRSGRVQQLLKYLIYQSFEGRNPSAGAVHSECFGDDHLERTTTPSVMRLLREKQARYNADPAIAHAIIIDIHPDDYRVLFRDSSLKPRSAIVLDESQITFRQFFGVNAFSLDHPSAAGVIVLQAHTAQTFLHGLVSRRGGHKLIAPSDVSIGPLSLFLKARSWINRWDNAGAREFADSLRDHSITPPKIVFREEDSDLPLPEGPYILSLGLGFSGRTERAFQNYQNLIRVALWDDCGDALSLHEDFVSGFGEWLRHEKPKSTPLNPDGTPQLNYPVRFERILPRSWSNRYIDKRLKRDGTERDYGIISRMIDRRQGQVLLVAAGFTDFGTFAAASFLAEQWPTLWTDVASKKVEDDSSKGDFIILIEGPCSLTEGKLQGWSEVCKITPAELTDKKWKRNQRGEWVKDKGSMKGQRSRSQS